MAPRSKYPDRIEYDAQAAWNGKTGGTAKAGSGYEIKFDTPQIYGGNETAICPDEMFVASILGCLMNTFLDFQRKTLLPLNEFTLQGKAIAEFDSTGYQITGVFIEGEVVVESDELDDARRAIELMKKYCHLTRSIADSIPFEYDISIREIE